MLEINQILIPIDFSDVSKKALSYAISLATACEANLLLTTVVEDSPAMVPGSQGSTPKKQKAFGEAKKKLDALLSENTRSSLNLSCVVKTGNVEEQILATAADEKVDLIFMGTHGRRAFKRWYLGSVTDRILRQVSVPVVTLSHPDAEVEPWNISGGRLLYATDLSHLSAPGLTVAYELACSLDAQLDIVHILLPWSGIFSFRTEDEHARIRERSLDRLEKSIPEAIRRDSRTRWELREGIPYNALVQIAEEKGADLTIVNLHGQHRMEQAVLGSTAERLIRGSRTPVLALPLMSPEHSHD